MTIPWLMNCPHDGSGWCLDCVRELAEERNALRDTVDKLPKTADGVPIVPGMTVEVIDRDPDTLKPTEKFLTRRVLSFAHDPQLSDGSLWWVVVVPLDATIHSIKSLRSQETSESMYSTRAAAESAKDPQ
jgi:hypothetical protein